MRSFHSRTKKYGSALAVASLAVAASAAATATAQADPDSGRVKLKGNASCQRFDDAVVDEVSVSSKGQTKTDQLSGEDEAEKYALTFTKVTKSTNGQDAKAKVTCIDSDGDTHTYGKSFKLKRPAGNTETQVLNLK